MEIKYHIRCMIARPDPKIDPKITQKSRRGVIKSGI